MKKIFRNYAKIMIAGIISLSMLVTPVAADEQSDLELENENLMAQVEADEQKLNELKENINDIENYIEEINAAVDEIEGRIADYEDQKISKQSEIEVLKKNISDLESGIRDKEEEIQGEYSSMKKRIKFLYENVGDSYLESIFASTSFSEAVEKIQYMLELTSYDRRMMVKIQGIVDGIKEDKEEISSQVAEIEVQVADIENLSEAQEANQALLEEAREMKGAELAEVKQEASEYEEAISSLNAQIAANQSEIDAIIANYLASLEAMAGPSEEELASIEAESIEAEMRAAEESASIEQESIEAELRAAEEAASIEAEEESRRLAAEENGEDYVPGEYNTTEWIPPETTTWTAPNTGGGGYSGNDSFIWPLNGYYTITSYFGDRSWDPDIPAGAEWHYGVDIYAPSGTPILAVADGVVTYVGWSDAIGNVICVYHAGTGVTTEMHHMSGAAVGVGTVVSQGDVIGYVGATGYLCTGAHLHFAVIPGSDPASEGYVDPLGYLP